MPDITALHRFERHWAAEHARWQTAALPVIRERLTEHLRTLREDSNRSTSELQRRIAAIQRDRYKWAEHAMDGVVPADIAREKQVTLARQLASLEGEALEVAGVDTEATLRQMIDLISDPARFYKAMDPGLRRTYNQAWFTRIYLDAVPDDPDQALDAAAERTVIADALDASRELTVATLGNDSAGPVGPADLVMLGVHYARGSIKNPLVELRGFEPLTFSFRVDPDLCSPDC